ncbi:MAG: hypothetical protein QG671_1943 [Actinomycetota bacterium]|nr:hypothetical protein [Actinomycetota bacterium]
MHGFQIIGPPARRDPIADHFHHYRRVDRQRVLTQAKTAIATVDLLLDAAAARKRHGTWTPHWIHGDPEGKGALAAVNHMLNRKRQS